jgi:hypothetical protein
MINDTGFEDIRIVNEIKGSVSSLSEVTISITVEGTKPK